MRPWYLIAALSLFPIHPAAAEEITWLLKYEGSEPTGAPTWAPRGKPKVEATAAGVHLTDDSDAEEGCFRASWKPDPAMEVVIEARLKMGAMTGAFKSEVWPWRDGAPV